MDGLNLVFQEINECFENARRELWKPDDYCEAGMSRCVCCGWVGDYPLSGCPSCNHSFTE
jgi:hypothetical protein